MKKCVCVSCFDYYTTRIEELINFFKTQNYDVTYLYADYDHFSKKKNNNFYECGERIHVKRYAKNLSLNRLYSHYEFAKKVGKRIKTIAPDIIYCIVPPNYLVKELSNYKRNHPKTKLVYDVYDMWPESIPYAKKSKTLKIPFSVWRRLRSKNIAEADLVLCVSEQGKASLLPEVKSTPVKVLKPVIAAGDMPDYHPNVEELSFCYLGMINHITDMELGVELLGGLAKEKPTTLHIIGEGQNLNTFVDKLRERNVEVVCHGCIFDRKEKNKIFEQCNMGLNIPRKEIQSSMSLKAIEYMRVGLPFINNACGDIRKIVQDGQVGINCNENIKDTIKYVLELSEDSYQEMHNRCESSYLKHFIAQDYNEILDGLII